MDTNLDGDGSSSDLDISSDINGCIKSLDDDIEGPVKSKVVPAHDQSSRSSSSSSSSSSSDSSSSSSSKSSKTSSSHKKSKEKAPDPKVIAPPPQTSVTITDRVLYPAKLYKKPLDKNHKVQNRSRSRSRAPRPTRESGYKTDGSVTSDKSMRRRKSRAPSAPRVTADIDLDLCSLQLSTEPSTSVKLTKRNVNLMARKNDTNNNQSSNNKLRPTALNLELNRRLLEHKMDLNGKTTSFSTKTGFKGFKSSQSFQELTATSRVMAPSWTAQEKVSSKPVKYAKSLPRPIKSRRSSVASRAGSVRSATSTISRMKRATTPAVVKNNEYVVSQVAEITAALAKCSISSTKNSKNLKMLKALKTPTSKKKKTVNKRRSKKNDLVPVAEDHKLPLKKRHYLIADDNGNAKRKRLKKSAPPGIFEPTEQHDDSTAFDVFNIMCPIVPETKPAAKSVVDNILTKMDPTGNKRKRRRANRTGFPTPKRPKKKVINDNASDTSSVVQKRARKPKSVPEENLQNLSLRQLQLKQQKEIELTNSLESRTIRGRAKSVCHVEEPEPVVKRKRRQTIFVDKEDIFEKIEAHTIKKRRQTILIDSPIVKKPKIEPKKQDPLTPDCPVKLIPKNVYNGDTQKRAFVASLKGTKCRCLPNPCGESCLNRSMFIECDVGICGKSCTNTAIQTGGLLNKEVEKFQTEHKGFGVRTKKDIPKKTLILEYTGEVLFLEAFRQRMQTIYKNDQHHYCLELSGGLVLDGHRMGSLCRFVNHSCKPNCGMAKIYVDGLPRMILQAEEDILHGTELTYDYKFDNFDDMTPQQCFCGADTCRGTLSAHMKAPRRASMSTKVKLLSTLSSYPKILFNFQDGEVVVKRGRKGRTAMTCAKTNSCFLMRNLRRVEKKILPDVMAFYRNDKNILEGDPKVGFAFVSKTHESPPPSPEVQKPEEEIPPKEPEPIVVQQPLSEQSQILWQICELLESSNATKIEEMLIPPPPKTGHSNHDRISLPISFEDIKQNVKMGHYDLHPLLFHYNIKILLDNVVKYWGVNCPQYHSMLILRDAYKQARNDLIEEIKRVWSDELFVNAMMDKVFKKPAKNRKKVAERQDEEDIVNCHCGRYLEEGLMIQCQKCLTWQHVDCAEADGKDENYTCAKCEGKPLQLEILKKDETTADGHQCYLTLMRGDLQVKHLKLFVCS